MQVQYFTPLDTVKSDVPNLWYLNVSINTMWKNASFAAT